MNKLIKVYDCDGYLNGYKMGEYYLMKHYTWGNKFDWIINKTGDTHYYEGEFWDKVDLKEVILCENFKDGKMKLMELNA